MLPYFGPLLKNYIAFKTVSAFQLRVGLYKCSLHLWSWKVVDLNEPINARRVILYLYKLRTSPRTRTRIVYSQRIKLWMFIFYIFISHFVVYERGGGGITLTILIALYYLHLGVGIWLTVFVEILHCFVISPSCVSNSNISTREFFSTVLNHWKRFRVL